jgi:hypothetical protein
MAQFRPSHPVVPQASPPAPTAPPPEHWADLLSYLVRQEVDAGRLVRLSLPGARVPVLVEDAYRWSDVLVAVDPQGGRYMTASPAGVVLVCDPVPRVPGDDYASKVDGL